MALSENSGNPYIQQSRARYADRPRPTTSLPVAAALRKSFWPEGTVRARQRAALLALRTVAQPRVADLPGSGSQHLLKQWSRAVANWLGLL